MSWHFLLEKQAEIKYDLALFESMEVKIYEMPGMRKELQAEKKRTDLLFALMCGSEKGSHEEWSENWPAKKMEIQKTDRQRWICQSIRVATSLFRRAFIDSRTCHSDGIKNWKKNNFKGTCSSYKWQQAGQQTLQSSIDVEIRAFKFTWENATKKTGFKGTLCVNLPYSPGAEAVSSEAISWDGKWKACLVLGRWLFEPPIPRTGKNIPARVDRLKALGNAQVASVTALAFVILSEGLI